MKQRFDHGKVRIMQLGVFADQRNGDAAVRGFDTLHHFAPSGKIGRMRTERQLFAYHIGKTGLFQKQRNLIEC